MKSLRPRLSLVDNPESCLLELYVVVDHEQVLSTKQVLLGDGVSRKLASLFLRKLRDYRDDDEYKLVDVHEIDDTKKKQLYYTNKVSTILSEFKEIYELRNSLVSDTFLMSEIETSTIRGYWIRIGFNDEIVLLYKHNYSFFVLKTTDKMMRRFSFTQQNTLEIMQEAIFQFNEKFEVIVHNDGIIVTSISFLEKVCKFDEYLRDNAKQVLEWPQVTNALSGKQFVFDAIERKKKWARKLGQIKTDSMIIEILGDAAKLRNLGYKLRNHPVLKSRIKYESGKLHIKSMVAAENFISLLHDNFVKSLFTDMEFEAISKEDLVLAEDEK